MGDARISREFLLRDEWEREELLGNMWCDYCAADDLGLDNPDEYEVRGTVYLEGQCKNCGRTIVSAIAEQKV